MELAARALAEAGATLNLDMSTPSTRRYLFASRQIERLVTASTLLSLVCEVRAARLAEARIERALSRLELVFEEDGA